MEESGAVEGADKSHVWHIDPLDGTSNFLHGIPIFAVSVALERDGQIVAGLVYNPASDDLYVAEKGQGAFHNNRRMRVAARRTLAESMVACGIPRSPVSPIMRAFRSSWRRSWRRSAISDAWAPPPWTSPWSRRADATDIGNAASKLGT